MAESVSQLESFLKGCADLIKSGGTIVGSTRNMLLESSVYEKMVKYGSKTTFLGPQQDGCKIDLHLNVPGGVL